MNEEQILQLVKKHLDNHQIPENPIEVLDRDIYKVGDWWHVPVRPHQPFPKTYQYYEELTNVEMDLKEKEQVDVLLVPAG